SASSTRLSSWGGGCGAGWLPALPRTSSRGRAAATPYQARVVVLIVSSEGEFEAVPPSANEVGLPNGAARLVHGRPAGGPPASVGAVVTEIDGTAGRKLMLPWPPRRAGGRGRGEEFFIPLAHNPSPQRGEGRNRSLRHLGVGEVDDLAK